MFFLFFTIISVLVGPWVTNMNKDGFSVLWTTDDETVGWVQVKDGEKFYEKFAGRMVFGTFHRVDVKLPCKGQIVEYVIGNIPVIDKSRPAYPKYGDEMVTGSYKLLTFNTFRDTCSFVVMNDIHSDATLYSSFASQIDTSRTDFIVLNGDIASLGNYSREKLAELEIKALGSLSAVRPVVFARGNHEGRGDGVKFVSDIFPNSQNDSLPFTYFFREGRVAFMVLDAGETGVVRSRALTGEDIYKPYLLAQLEWAKSVVKNSDWVDASARICIIHAPMANYETPGEREVYAWMNRNFVPFLNDAGLNYMICADFHVHQFIPANVMGNNFPILINDNKTRLEVSVECGDVSVKAFGSDGKRKFN